MKFGAVVLIAFLVTFAVFGAVFREKSIIQIPPAAGEPGPPLPADARVAVVQLGKAWVFDRRLPRRTCPAEGCGVVGQYFFAEAVDVLQIHEGWARTTEPYDGSCINGRSDFVESGNSACNPTNGISDGRFAEWVQVSGLTADKPPEEPKRTDGLAELLHGSNDFDAYEEQFIAAAQQALDRGYCSVDEVGQLGGWLESQSFKGQRVYFLKCGQGNVYVDVDAGRLWRD